MNDPLAGLEDALRTVRAKWGSSDAFAPTVDGLGRTRLMAVTEALGVLRRHVDAVQASVAAEVARESRVELGADSLAKQQGFRSPAILIAATTGMSTGDAVRLVKVGEATAPRTTLMGDAAPAKHPHVADAFHAGRIGREAASAIICMLDRVALRADRDALDRCEQTLVVQAVGLTLDQLTKIIARAEAWLDPDGLEPKELDTRGERAVHVFERDGMLQLTGKWDVESGAPIKTVLEAMVSAAFHAAKDAGAGAEVPSVPQLQADALTALAWHALGCDRRDLPMEGATVVVRVSLDDLDMTGDAADSATPSVGVATIDGIAQPVSIAAVRRLAAGGRVIPCVLGSDSEILDWGREKRLFTRAQRLALTERDGGCAMCGLPPGMTRAHHMRWWLRDTGPTDLSNGLLLCESCHHRIHDNGWEVRIDGVGSTAQVWFIPPPHVDPRRTPRLGGRARFDYRAA